MKLKTAVLYRYEKFLKAIAICFGLLVIPIIGVLIAEKINKYLIFGYESRILFMLCCILSMILGMSAYKSALKFFLQNGVSRQSAHFSFLLSLLVGVIIAAAEATVHTVISLISVKLAEGVCDTSKYIDAFKLDFCYSGGIFKQFLMRILITSCAFIVLMSFGYMLSAIFSSIKPFYKVLVIVVLVVLIIFALILSTIYDSYASIGMPTYLAFLFYFLFGSPWAYFLNHYIVSMIILTVLFSSISHLIIRKAVIRK